ncbi:MAG: metallophosphoesterase [Elusimicrobia bacterium]|nr:metallophosphoesterase [Elusimicrobiota bacterium]
MKIQPGKTSCLAVLLKRTALVLASIFTICIAYGYFIEPYWPQVITVRLTSQKLAQGTKPIRIVHISDIHSDPKPRLEDRLPDIIASLKPDLNFFTGDAVNSPDGLPVFKRCLAQIAAIAPTFAVKGNFDGWSNLDYFGGIKVQELAGNAVKVSLGGGTDVWVTGVLPASKGLLDKALLKIPSGTFVIFLHHYPDLIYEAAEHKVDLYLAGHTHGGQVAMPFYGALITLAEYGKRFEAGLYQVDQTRLYVNRGIGMEGPRVRFFARPEITLIEIGPQ